MGFEMDDRRYSVTRYNETYRERWDDFVDASRNATFLLKRLYMEYHSDRFTDASLVITDRHDHIVALFAASVEGDVVTAHGGLTYGGVVLPRKKVNAADTLEIFGEVVRYLREDGVKHLIYKAIPHIYHVAPSDDDIYALFRFGASLTEVNVSSAIYLPDVEIAPDSNSLRGSRRALNCGVSVVEVPAVNGGGESMWCSYWALLSKLLRERYDAAPVHSYDEIAMLAERFPDNIKLFVVVDSSGDLLGGTVVYETRTVAHTQYIASSDRGREMGALHMLMLHLVDRYRGVKRYFDLGTSNESHGLFLNEGLIRQKSGYGARAVAHQIFTLEL